jgi:hypothetical protein
MAWHRDVVGIFIQRFFFSLAHLISLCLIARDEFDTANLYMCLIPVVIMSFLVLCKVNIFS